MEKSVQELLTRIREFGESENERLDSLRSHHFDEDETRSFENDLKTHLKDLKKLLSIYDITVDEEGRTQIENTLYDRKMCVQDIENAEHSTPDEKKIPHSIMTIYGEIKKLYYLHYQQSQNDLKIKDYIDRCFGGCRTVDDFWRKVHKVLIGDDIPENYYPNLCGNLVLHIRREATYSDGIILMEDLFCGVYQKIVDYYVSRVKNLMYDYKNAPLEQQQMRSKLLFETLWEIRPLSDKQSSQVLSGGQIKPEPILPEGNEKYTDDDIVNWNEKRSFKPIKDFDVRSLYNFLFKEEVFVRKWGKEVSFELFSKCLEFATFSPIWALTRHNKMKGVIKHLKWYFQKEWHLHLAEEIKNIGSINRGERGSYTNFEDRVESCLSGKIKY